MPIVRTNTGELVKRGRSYTTVPNESIDKISNTDALAIWLYLQSKPEGWDIRPSNIMAKFTNLGRVRYRHAMKYLEEQGFITYETSRDEKGHLHGKRIILHSEPVHSGGDGNESQPPKGQEPVHSGGDGNESQPPKVQETERSVSPKFGKPAPLVSNEGLVRIEGSNKNLSSSRDERNDVGVLQTHDSNPRPETPPKPWLDDDLLNKGFEIFWSAGMRKAGKKPCQKKFSIICKSKKIDPLEFGERLACDVRARIEARIFGFTNLMPQTYLNQERWNDELPCTETDCPVDTIIDAWNKEFPDKPAFPDLFNPGTIAYQNLIETWQRGRMMRKQNGAPCYTSPDEGLEYWDRLIRYAALSDLLRGSPWFTLDWLAKMDNFLNVRSKKYHQMAG